MQQLTSDALNQRNQHGADGCKSNSFDVATDEEFERAVTGFVEAQAYIARSSTEKRISFAEAVALRFRRKSVLFLFEFNARSCNQKCKIEAEAITVLIEGGCDCVCDDMPF